MKSYKTYRWDNNPEEKLFHDMFLEEFNNFKDETINGMIFGWGDDHQTMGNNCLTIREQRIVLSVVQWLGSSVGSNFVDIVREEGRKK